jgi:hypothetical protein
MINEPVAAVVVNWNGGEVVHECLRSLTRSTYPALTLIMVDNGSTDGSPQAVKQQVPSVQVIENHRNLGYAEGANIGIRMALTQGAQFVFLLNNDLTVDIPAIGELASVLHRNPQAGIVGAKIYRQDDPTRLYCVWEEIRYHHVITQSVGEFELDQGQYDHVREIDCACGAAMMVRREVFERVGLFDPSYFAYQEQVDFCERARKRGAKILFVPAAKVRHHGEYSLRSRNALQVKTYLLRRNSVLFMKKHGNWRTWSRFLFFVALTLTATLLTESVRGRFGFFLARLKGFRDGFTGKAIDGDKLLSIL